MRRCLYFALVLVPACTTDPPDPPAPQPIGVMGSAAAGLAYAEQTCASCHAVRAGETDSPYFGAPSFEEIANTPGMTGLALQVWLRSPHENMPQIIVEPDRVDDVWAYISSLETR